MTLRHLVALVAVMAACAAPLATQPAMEPTAGAPGVLLAILRGPERVPVPPHVARMREASAQIAARLGHPLRVDIDGALLPDDRDAADAVMAELVETIANDLETLANEHMLAFAAAQLDYVVVRYSPTDATERRATRGAAYDVTAKRLDIARSTTGYSAAERGDIAAPIERAYRDALEARYAQALPDAISADEWRDWLEVHIHTNRRTRPLGPSDALTIRGMVMLATLAHRDAELAAEVRGWLVDLASAYAGAYSQDADAIQRAPQGSEFRTAEATYMAWLAAELPRMTPAERGKIIPRLFVVDLHAQRAPRDRYAAFAFPGIDRMALVLQVIDAWAADGHKADGKVSLYGEVVCPFEVDHGRLAPLGTGEDPYCRDRDFYGWALADDARMHALADAVIARNDPVLAAVVSRNVFYASHGDGHLRYLRRLERAPAPWRITAELEADVQEEPGTELLEEARRWWRAVPHARGVALFWFARKAEHAYEPAKLWPELLQDGPVDAAALTGLLELGWPAFQLMPVVWPTLAGVPGHTRAVTEAARNLLGARVEVQPGGRNVAGIVAALAVAACEDKATADVAELRAFARDELASHPGDGLSDIVAATEPAACKPRRRLGEMR
jgi:hypothetical protein